jgi:hypothetical protein
MQEMERRAVKGILKSGKAKHPPMAPILTIKILLFIYDMLTYLQVHNNTSQWTRVFVTPVGTRTYCMPTIYLSS